MSFVQVIDCRTKRADELAELDRKWEAEAAGAHRLRRRIVARDRQNPEHHLVLVFFDSAEDAAFNSNLPVTQQNSAKYAALMEAPPSFTDLDILADQTY